MAFWGSLRSRTSWGEINGMVNNISSYLLPHLSRCPAAVSHLLSGECQNEVAVEALKFGVL